MVLLEYPTNENFLVLIKAVEPFYAVVVVTAATALMARVITAS
jgi:hypothetical protein